MMSEILSDSSFSMILSWFSKSERVKSPKASITLESDVSNKSLNLAPLRRLSINPASVNSRIVYG